MLRHAHAAIIMQYYLCSLICGSPFGMVPIPLRTYRVVSAAPPSLDDAAVTESWLMSSPIGLVHNAV
jgi:hypothetical protein